MNEQERHIPDIMHYEPKIFSCADLLISSGIKQSKFPDYMMPFFALMMLEGRMRNEISEMEREEGLTRENDIDEFVEAFRDRDCGYNEYIVRDGKTLADICDNDKTFEQDFWKYLSGFDGQLKELLGIERGTDDSKYLNLDGVIAELRKKGILMQYITKWAEIDLSPYNNSDITTLEEHIKRKWADMSAETAGEQYTPEDIISLIAEIVAKKLEKPKDQYVWLYDPTCGGANLLFGVADRLKESGYDLVATNGQDYNDALYALAKIESLFRDQSEIKYGNTLTEGKFPDKEFDVIVANPPYGIPWKGYEKYVKKDQTGQFQFYPSVDDGQLLFLQHNAHHLHQDSGIVVEVNNGSSLFTGDAGSGESNIRKYLFDKDWVEALIQMPGEEFFNTGIVTYLWVLNKNKSVERKDKVILINASDLWEKMADKKGDKRKQMNADHRRQIVNALMKFEDSEISRVYPKWHFYFNKQQIELTEIDKEGRYVSSSLGCPGETFKIDKIEAARLALASWVWPIDGTFDDYISETQSPNIPEGETTVIFTEDFIYYTGKECDGVYRVNRKTKDVENLGDGKIVTGLNYSKKTDKHSITAKIEDKTYKDYEYIPFDPDPEKNEQEIDDFLKKYIFKPYKKVKNVVGVEVNFNKEFYVPETLEPVNDILAEISELDSQLVELEKGLGL